MFHHAPASEPYELLVSLLAKRPQTIEILPDDCAIWTDNRSSNHTASDPSFSPFLFVDRNLGIPQNVLYKVYLHAVGLFKSARACMKTGPTMTSERNRHPDASLAHVLVNSSSILLLANPSNQTALNARKHLVRMHLIDPHAELLFTASLLSSQCCTRTAELWYHRRWLLSGSFNSQLSDNAGIGTFCGLQLSSRETLQRELELVSRACELYPRNYFAWIHRLACMRSALSDYLAGTDAIGFASMLRNEIAEIKGWIDHHVSDYSAIHTILALSQVVFQSRDSSLLEIIVEGDLSNHAISLVQEYPAHEALWMYIRTVLSIPGLRQAQQTGRFVDGFVKPLAHLQHMETATEEDLAKASHHARLFIDRGYISS